MRIDPGKMATSAVRSATSPRQVLATVVVVEGKYMYCKQVSLCYEPTPVSIKLVTPISYIKPILVDWSFMNQVIIHEICKIQMSWKLPAIRYAVPLVHIVAVRHYSCETSVTGSIREPHSIPPDSTSYSYTGNHQCTLARSNNIWRHVQCWGAWHTNQSKWHS